MFMIMSTQVRIAQFNIQLLTCPENNFPTSLWALNAMVIKTSMTVNVITFLQPLYLFLITTLNRSQSHENHFLCGCVNICVQSYTWLNKNSLSWDSFLLRLFLCQSDSEISLSLKLMGVCVKFNSGYQHAKFEIVC